MVPNCLIFLTVSNLFQCFCQEFNKNAKEVLRIAPYKWIGEYDEKRDILYCNELCSDKEKPIICDCKKRAKNYPNCVYYFPKRQVDFRLQMTFAINSFRNKIAGGEGEAFYLPGSSDMNAVSYDMGLEYSAQCSAHTCNTNKDTCIKMDLYPVIKQVVMHEVLKEFTTMRKIALVIYGHWIKLLTQSIDHEEERNKDLNTSNGYAISSKKEWTEWHTIVWSRATAIGCSIKQTKSSSMQKIEIFIVCNFGGSVENPNGSIYKLGASGTSCDKNITKNLYFNSICGFMGMIPISDIYNGVTKTNWEKNRAIFVFGWILLLLYYYTNISFYY